jgi:hypothetical protein
MHPGVRAAGPVDRLANPLMEVCQRGFEFPLDRPDPRSLDLEAGIVRAVVFDRGAKAPRRDLSIAMLLATEPPMRRGGDRLGP